MKSEGKRQKSEARIITKPRCPQNQPRRFATHVFALLASILLCALLAASPGQAATIHGKVLDPSGKAVSGAHVTLMQGLVPLEDRRSDSEGDYRFDGLGRGSYSLIANSPGFTGSSTRVEIANGGETRQNDLRLHLSAVQQHIVVSASLGGALASQIGSSVNVISHQEIEDRGAQNLYEALRGVPGVEVNQTGRRGGVASVFVRGGNSDYNLVMMDGIQLNEFGGDFDFSSLPADGVDHVEVTRDPESALYGSNAVTSVINIVTHQGDGPPRFTGLEEMGSNLTWRFATGGSGLTKGLSWAYDLSRLDSDGVVQNDNYRDQSAFLSLSFSQNPRRQVYFHFFGNANDAGAPGPYGSDPDHLFAGIDTVSRDKQNLFGYDMSYAENFTPNFRQVITGSIGTNRYYFISPFGDSYSHNFRAVLNTQSQLTLSSQDFLVAGFEYNREQIKNTFIADANNTPFLLPRTSYAAFAENRWVPGRLSLTAGVRVDDIQTRSLPPGAFGERPLLPASSVAKVNPHLSAAYLLREGSRGGGLGLTRLHSSFGTGIRAPDGFELAFTNNPRLKPERSVSLDSGIEQRFFSGRAALDATYFYNRFEDQIVVLGGSLTNLSTFVSDNLGNSRAQGMELSLRVQPAPSISVSGEYTLLDTSILALNGADAALAPFHVGQELFRRPRNSAFFNVTWTHRQLMLNANAYIRGAVLDLEPNDGLFACTPVAEGGFGLPCLFTNKGYTDANFGFSYRLPYGIELYGRLNNFLNRKYEESLGFPALRLNFLAGIKFDFPAE